MHRLVASVEVEAACIIGQNQTHALIELAAPLCADEIADKYGALSSGWNYDLACF